MSFFFAGCRYDHQAFDDGFGFTNRFRFGNTSAGAGKGDKSPSPKISPKISPALPFKKCWNFKDLRKISPISPISPASRGYFVMRLHTLIHKETLNFTLLIYICMRQPNPRNPERRGDFGDIGDIFGKPSDHAGLRVLGSGDILGMSPGDGDVPEGRGCPRGTRMSPRDGDDLRG